MEGIWGFAFWVLATLAQCVILLLATRKLKRVTAELISDTNETKKAREWYLAQGEHHAALCAAATPPRQVRSFVVNGKSLDGCFNA